MLCKKCTDSNIQATAAAAAATSAAAATAAAAAAPKQHLSRDAAEAEAFSLEQQLAVAA